MPFFETNLEAIFFRDKLREARALALEDAEGYQEILFTLEMLGSFLLKERLSLGRYESKIRSLAENSSLSFNRDNVWHSNFDTLFQLVRTGRNDALHHGSVARHLTESAVKLALLIEDSINRDARLMKVSDLMIRNPICTDLWQPLSFVRQQMLLHSFSFLPFVDELGDCHFLSDFRLAKYFNSSATVTHVQL